jgi:hypothetical protein
MNIETIEIAIPGMMPKNNMIFQPYCTSDNANPTPYEINIPNVIDTFVSLLFYAHFSSLSLFIFIIIHSFMIVIIHFVIIIIIIIINMVEVVDQWMRRYDGRGRNERKKWKLGRSHREHRRSERERVQKHKLDKLPKQLRLPIPPLLLRSQWEY